VEAGRSAQEEFERVFSRRENPTDMEEVVLSAEDAPGGQIFIVKLLVQTGLAPSNKEARRLLTQGAVQLNGEKITEARDVDLGEESIVKVGRRFLRVKV